MSPVFRTKLFESLLRFIPNRWLTVIFDTVIVVLFKVADVDNVILIGRRVDAVIKFILADENG